MKRAGAALVRTITSFSDLLSHYNAMLEAKNIVKRFQIHPFWVCHKRRLGEFTTTSGMESCYHNSSSSMRNEWNWNAIALWWTPHRMHCFRIPSCQVEKWEIVPFILLISTVSNAQAPYDKLRITQRVNPPSLNIPTEEDVGTWDISYF